MRKKEKTRVIWRHPQGRFEIQETEHYSLFDHCTYYTRECVFTPQDDARGLCSEVPTGIFVPELCTPQKGVQCPVSDADVDQWCEWYKAGKNVADIAEMARRSKATVAARLRARGLLPDPVPRVTDEEVREMARLFASGLSVREVAKATKRNMRTVREHLRETRAIR